MQPFCSGANLEEFNVGVCAGVAENFSVELSEPHVNFKIWNIKHKIKNIYIFKKTGTHYIQYIKFKMYLVHFAILALMSECV